MDEDHDMESMEESENTTMEEQPTEADVDKEVYLPSQPLADGEVLECDQSAYVMYHQAQTGAPCLSFDILRDTLGDNREDFPLSCYMVTGTQSPKVHLNTVLVIKFSNLHKTNSDEDSSDDDSDEDSEDERASKEPHMTAASLSHTGCVNRIRGTTFNDKPIVATWSETGRVNIYDLTRQVEAVDNPQVLLEYNKDSKNHSPLYTFNGHTDEGYGLDWCQTMPGILASGDCKKNIHIWQPQEGGTWQVDHRPLVGHEASVEDLQWSPNERHVLASCSVDKTIRIWDTRNNPSKACMLTANDAHQSDVNVINWNKNEPFIVSGGDDGFVHIWDLRKFQGAKPMATFKHHTSAITTVEWHPTDSAVFSSGGADDQIAIWDLSVEKDAQTDEEEVDGIPPQLLFIHQGQTDIKELHWHPQLPGVIISTAGSGFNIFKTISV